ncbi:hypothetical protein [Acinetobacter soli]|uniref:hypothetical protein n=1 Tax=Acinetobacter soli TaxID=487316 RepID=UPI00125ED746|nr:hypothetical protein [Acinetobacter soli]
MHQSIKTVVRLVSATCIFLITAALILTFYSKAKEIWNAEDEYTHKQISQIQSDATHTYRLLSNNKKPNQAFYIVLQDRGYIAKLNCEHYLASLCTDRYNEIGTRVIQDATFQTFGTHSYLEKIRYMDTQTNMPGSYTWSEQDIKSLYAQDMSNLKYVLFGVGIFALIALYCSYRILRNFKQFLKK